MIASIQYIEQKFGEFNRLFFGGRLPILQFELSDASRFLGQFNWDEKTLPDGRIEKSNFKLRVNTRIDMTQDALDDVIIHEMIHYFIDYHNLVDSSPHGNIFRAIMESINVNHGRHIEVAHRNPSEEEKKQAVSKKPVWHVIAEIELNDGSYGVKVLPRMVQKILGFYKAVCQSPKVKDVKLYLHNNPFFNRFPTSAALKYEPLDHKLFLTNIVGAKKLIINNNQLIPVNQ